MDIGERIDALERTLADQQIAVFKAQTELNDLKLEYVKGAQPEWKQKVSQAHKVTDGESALSTVLHFLKHLADPRSTTDPAWNLARVVAICEQESGEVADPDGADWGADDDPIDVLWLLDSLTRFLPPSNWRITGNRAAYWLRDILSKESL